METQNKVGVQGDRPAPRNMNSGGGRRISSLLIRSMSHLSMNGNKKVSSEREGAHEVVSLTAFLGARLHSLPLTFAVVCIRRHWTSCKHRGFSEFEKNMQRSAIA